MQVTTGVRMPRVWRSLVFENQMVSVGKLRFKMVSWRIGWTNEE
jgi:hypothetical protein